MAAPAITEPKTAKSPTAVNQLLTADINRPGRYLGTEYGSHHKPWNAPTVRWVLTYPEIYEVGASNLGHVILYNILNTQPRQLCDRAYLPALDLCEKLTASNTPLFGVENKRPLTDYDILGFSLSYELGATNILEMLTLAQVPLTWEERNGLAQGSDWGGPLIFAGGQTATSNPEPYVDFFDFVVLGDGEEVLPEIGLVLDEAKENGLTRQETLLDLAQVPGVYVPQFYAMGADGAVHRTRPDVPEKILRRVATPIPAYSIGLVPYVETVHDRLTMEIRRGCTRGCRFCQPGMLTRPARDVAPDEVVDAVVEGMQKTGFNEFSLLSLSCSDYLALPAVGLEIKNRLSNENISLSLPSQRVDRFDENIANIVGGIRTSSLTFAPEAGTQRLRDIINKGLTNEELLRGIRTAREQGWDKVKLYFMIGLPGETDADVLGIAETVRWLQRECRMENRRRMEFNLTISNFTPKPHTPFQWHSVSIAEFQRKRDMLATELRTIRGLKTNYTDYQISAMEDFVGRGDRRLGAVVKRAWELGAGMDAWWESVEKAHGAWTQAIEEAGLSWKYRQVEAGEWKLFEEGEGETDEERMTGVEMDWEAIAQAPLPWDHLDTGIDKQWLVDDLRNALAAAVVPDCSFDACSHCGVCGLDFGHNIIVKPPEIPEFTGHFKPNTTRAQRLRFRFGKEDDMALLGHLDLMRLFDRAIRRAQLPISFTGGYHPGPRIVPANALSLGITSSGEILDIDLTEELDPEAVRNRLATELPDTLPLYSVEAIDVKGKAASQLLESATYEIEVEIAPISESDASDDDSDTPNPVPAETPTVTIDTWQHWIDSVLAADSWEWEKLTKKKKKKVVDIRPWLLELAILKDENSDNGVAAIKLKFTGLCRNDGTVLRPELIRWLLEKVSGQQLALKRIHRKLLMLT
ncbi:MAG: TIGR03960 family B12-binding radical SAM protein [Cyanophyceae cyanobacterium]